MSGSPKYSRPRVRSRRRRALEEASAAQALADLRFRQEVEARAREAERQRQQSALDSERNCVAQQFSLLGGCLLAADAQRLQAQWEALPCAVDLDRPQDSPIAALREFEFALHEAKVRWQEAEAQKAFLEKSQRIAQQISAAKDLLAGYNLEVRRRFDPVGFESVILQFSKAETALAQSNLGVAEQLTLNCKERCSEHVSTVHRALIDWQRQRDEALVILAQANSLQEVMDQDRTVSRWMPRDVENFKDSLRALKREVESEQWAAVRARWTQLEEQQQEIVKAANAKQLAADQRDAIASSVHQALESMGFFVSPPQPEHPEHPATSVVMFAQSAAGRSVGVSVPLEGDIWYDIDGYSKTQTMRNDGRSMTSCDDAEAMLAELGRILDEVHEIDMGELRWEGKDPERVLRKADELPRGQRESERRQGC